ncbi:efflux RND transporter permease subunit [Aminithiophilus ramosus]|uniref:Efflux RND transporter permease subunit n=1 Tax=Aminithiophilus ramosus TaxID=3029084 RepID=A0A9Q7A793_9BACT|nr:efflux RND transporter permease subunit [Aminithiophilus ramosus]QTX32086.1 efflux RND transporter permease subunit [Aminithiophilus ramosus]
MNIASFAIRKKTVTLFLTVLMVVGGILAYGRLGKLEDPEFTIKTAVVVTTYPGATPREVEEEVTDAVETAVQQLGQVKRVRSISQEGMSTVYVDIKDTYTAQDLPQIWDELRRKVNDGQRNLPPGAGPSLVNDDYGAVYGVYFALTGEGYSLEELRRTADFLRKELLLVDGVARVEIGGIQKEGVFVEIARATLAQLGIPLNQIVQSLQAQNLVVSTGKVDVGAERLRIDPTGAFTSVEQIGGLLLRGSTGNLIRLDDIAVISREPVTPSQSLMRFDGRPAIGLGVANVAGGNVITMGEAVKKRLAELEGQIPLGMDLGLIYYQSDTVQASIDNFVVNLIEAVVIVIALLLVFMGLRTGLLIGVILLLTILATFVAMKTMAIDLQSISLGALIIALGMLVDNAIVVADGMLVRIETGQDGEQAAAAVVSQTQLPLLGATFIAILAFAPIGLSPDSTGEFCRSLFLVVAISLSLSWILAVTVTPLLGVMTLRSSPAMEGKDPYGGRLYDLYRSVLLFCLRRRAATVAVTMGLLALAFFGFGRVPQTFFPDSSSPQFSMDFWWPQGTRIEETSDQIRRVETFLLEQPETESVTTFVGQGALRFILNYTPGDPGSNYAQIIVKTRDAAFTRPLMEKVRTAAQRDLPDVEPRIKAFAKGTSSGAKVQVRLVGSDNDVLRRLGEEARGLMIADGRTVNIRNDWENRVKVIRPVIDEARARQAGLSRPDIAGALELAFGGTRSGLYREGDRLIPIIARFPAAERDNVETLPDTPVWSPLVGRYIALSQVTERLATVAEDPVIRRRDRMKTLTVECDAGDGDANALLERLRPRVEGLSLPQGYRMEWGGEYESSRDAQKGLMGMIPLGFLAIVVILVVLFNGLRETGLILLCLPLSLIGMTAGLLLMGQPFSFMALLGFLSLAGMLIKNAIVLLDQFNLEIGQGKPPFQAIVDSSVSRTRPVLMAALTTVLGMIPLYFDALFASMAVTIMFGLSFATVLTLLVVPVLYVLFFRIKEENA